MQKYNGLALKAPVLLAVLLTLGGCYTMLRHPRSDVDALDRAGYRGSDCASCHAGDFAEPLVTSPYIYVAPSFAGYYGCPWWLPDCGIIAGPAFPLYGGGGGGKGDDEKAERESKGRNIGGRGAAGLPHYLPPTTPAQTPSAQGTQTRSGDSKPQGEGQQPGRTMKDSGSSSSSSSPAPPPAPAPKKDAPKNKPKDDGGGRER